MVAAEQERLLVKQPSPPLPSRSGHIYHAEVAYAETWRSRGVTFPVLLVEVYSLTIHWANFLSPKSISVTYILELQPACNSKMQSVSLCSALMPYDGCSVCQAQMLLKLFQQSWSAARANVFISSTALCAQEPPSTPLKVMHFDDRLKA